MFRNNHTKEVYLKIPVLLHSSNLENQEFSKEKSNNLKKKRMKTILKGMKLASISVDR